MTKLILLFAAALLSISSFYTESKKELRRFAGRWKYVSSIVDGKAKSLNDLDLLTVVFTADGKMALYYKEDQVGQGDFTIDTTKTPYKIDLNYAERSEFNGKFEPVFHCKGIYLLKGNNLTECLTRGDAKQNRPTEFKSPSGNNLVLEKLKRITTPWKLNNKSSKSDNPPDHKNRLTPSNR